MGCAASASVFTKDSTQQFSQVVPESHAFGRRSKQSQQVHSKQAWAAQEEPEQLEDLPPLVALKKEEDPCLQDPHPQDPHPQDPCLDDPRLQDARLQDPRFDDSEAEGVPPKSDDSKIKDLHTTQSRLSFDDDPQARQLTMGQNGKEVENSLNLYVNVVEEPECLQSYQSFYYTPGPEDFALGHPIAPCGSSHKRHLKKIRKHLNSFETYPELFREVIAVRRTKMVKSLKKQEKRLAAASSKTATTSFSIKETVRFAEEVVQVHFPEQIEAEGELEQVHEELE
mmetsp:Transcript_37481/g.67798  ORF Transcript_37481/g.67798 Transcript_37481/m.67798 type:complete len:283 (-) Transcript_37481:187-1035(-)|eukprot:CAMPEP_0197663050 /NCGR_PEP_ID=MMETSP1338-20131121/55945_1 /TAXON_ID=43686 ORGANISM="Pelagodinium beii, Strain RCC1491" /NCGR_SAMPLE_ID=MMETSP1338 /ASSEMBLY_ACC=CAM_ASM_000754 /LENGTH=282 /DNA_ID=CAMNT_0043241243 /DNA_START=78 /DNA_END=926 /DNA_ORIENTATION=-